ncbi:MAG: TRAP transporter small permease subunit [Clostridia bacterium]|nr:TRAP transporter small permease subunit [Clostridia bacterium]
MKKICNMVEKAMYGIGMAAVAVFFLCTVVQVCSRAFGFQASFTEELANTALAWCCFIGAAPMVRSSEHFKFTAVTEKLKGRAFFIDELACLILVLAFNLVVGFYGVILVKQFSSWQMTSIPVSRGWCWMCVPIFGITSALFTLENIVEYIRHPESRRIVNAVDEAMKEVDS